MVDVQQPASVKTAELYGTESEPQSRLGTVVNNKLSTLVHRL